MPKVDVLLDGDGLRTDVGSAGFCATLLITSEDHRIVVDTGHVGRRTPLTNALAERGLTPADIDLTVMTHAHWDHAQNFDLFENATLLIHEWERKYANNPHPNDWATPRWTGAMIDFLERVQEVEDGYEVEPGVRLLHTPGHSAGTMAVVVDTSDGPVAITGDGIQNASVAKSRENVLVFWSEDDARRSIERVLGEAEIIYPGHDRPFRLLRDGSAEYLSAKHLTLFGVDLEEPGVSLSTTPRPRFVMPGIEGQNLDRLS